MNTPDLPANTVSARDRRAWRRWLERNHRSSSGVLLVRYKKTSGKACVPYEEAVEEALCFGWIDGKQTPLDEERYLLSFTPRKPRSTWALSNKRRVENLIRAGLMTPAGLEVIEVAKRNGSWTSLDDVEALVVPADLKAALAKNKKAKRHFDAFSDSNKKIYLGWIGSAKRPDTRAKRVAEAVRLCSENVRLQDAKAPPGRGGSSRESGGGFGS